MSKFKTFEETAGSGIELVNDPFVYPTGEWDNYIAYPTSNGKKFQYDQIKNQKHTDIRSFHTGKFAVRGIGFLNNLTMGDLNPTYIVDSINTSANTITTSVAHNLTANQSFVISGTVGNLSTGTLYYVKTTPNSTTFTLSSSSGGAEFDLTSSTVTIGKIISNKVQVQNLTSSVTLVASENWQAVSPATRSVGLQSSRNNWNGIAVTCTANATSVFYSLSPNNIDLSSYDDSSFDADYITLSCPQFPAGLKKTESSIEFTSGYSINNNEVTFIPNETDNINLGNQNINYKSKKIDVIKNNTSLIAYWRLEENVIDSIAVDNVTKFTPAIVATTGSETYTLSDGSITQINGTTIDAISISINDIILIKNAPTATSGTATGLGTAATSSSSTGNGIYIVTSIINDNLNVSRVSWANAWTELQKCYVSIEQGNNAGIFWTVNSIGTGILGTTRIRFTKQLVKINDELNVNNGELRGPISSQTNLDQAGAFQSSSSIYFDGDDNYIKIPYASNINASGSFTICAWCKPDSLTSDAVIIGNQGDSIDEVSGVNSTDTFTKDGHELTNGIKVKLSNLTGGSNLSTSTVYYVINRTNNTFQLSTSSGGGAVDLGSDVASVTVTEQSGYSVGIRQSDLMPFVDPGSGGTILYGSTAVSNNVWNLITFTYNSTTSTIKLYLNGNLIDTQTSTNINVKTFGNFYIGQLIPSGNLASNRKTFKGNIDEISLFNGAMSDSAILDIYDKCKLATEENVELQIPLKLLTKSTYTLNEQNQLTPDLIKGVRLNIKNRTNSSLTFTCLSIRCVSKNWIHSPIDINTQLGIIKLSPTPDGSAITNINSSNFAKWPINTDSESVNSYLPRTWPALFRSYEDNPSTFNVPDPIDGKIQAIFYTGAINQAIEGNENSLNIYFRATTLGVTNNYLNTKRQYELDNIGRIDEIFEDLEPYRQKDHSVIRGRFPVSRSALIPSPGPVIPFNKTESPYNQSSPSSDFHSVPQATTLAQPVLSNDNTITVADATNFPSSGTIYIKSDTPEYISYSSKVGNVLTVSGGRGKFNTVAVNHINGSSVHFYNQLNLTNPPYATTTGKIQGILNAVKTQSEMNDQTQFDLSYYITPTRVSYTTVKFVWYKTGGNIKSKILVHNETGPASGYSLDLPDNLIKQNAIYALIPEIKNRSIRAKLYELTVDQQGTFNYNHMVLIYDTGTIYDLSIADRRGRIGWAAQFIDGDVYVESIRSHGLTYAKLLSKPIQSYTPVKGSQSVIRNTPPKELYTTIDESPFNITTSYFMSEKNRVVANSTESYKVFNSEGYLQGVRTNYFEIEDFEDIEITFSVYKQLFTQKISAYLYQEERDVLVPVFVPEFTESKWHNIKLVLENDLHPSGIYCLLIVEDYCQNGSVWWVDEISIKKKTMNWFARSFVNGANEIGADNWLQIDNVINRKDGVAKFTTPGKELQLKGLAKNHSAAITELNIIPRYATLGSFRK